MAPSIRSTSGSSSSRLVMTALVCGSLSNLAKVAPPLKSTSTKLRISELCVTASASTRVRSSSLLPDPVGPAGPAAYQVQLIRVAQAEQFGQAQVGAHRLVAERRGGQPQRGQLPGK